MKKITEEWITKAERDYLVTIRELKANPPVTKAVCFHAQQCVEKWKKESQMPGYFTLTDNPFVDGAIFVLSELLNKNREKIIAEDLKESNSFSSFRYRRKNAL